MRKVHVITQKEAVSEDKLSGCSAAVIDVFLATSTIAFLLKNEYEPVYAVKDSEAALELSELQTGAFILLGETKGESIEGFQYPDPCLIETAAEKHSAIICSTNGTKAIESARGAETLYISSLVNGHLIAERLHGETGDSSIVLVCSGNDNRFSMEDFIGAGQIVEHLMRRGDYQLSDSSKLARQAYIQAFANSFEELMECETADLLRKFDFAESLELVIRNHEKVEVIPVFKDGKIFNDHKNAAGNQ